MSRLLLAILVILAYTSAEVRAGELHAETPKEDRLPLLLEQLEGEDLKAAAEAAIELGEFGAPASEALLARVAQRTRRPKTQAGRRLEDCEHGALSRLGKIAVPGLAKLSRETRAPHVHFSILRILYWIAYWKTPEDVIPALTGLLESPDARVVRLVHVHLREFKARSQAAIPSLVEALQDENPKRAAAARKTLRILGENLAAKGELRWWVVLQANRTDLGLLLLVLAAWFSVHARFPQHRIADRSRRSLMLLVASGVASSAGGFVAHAALSPEWITPYLPENPTALPFAVSGALTAAFVCALPGVWVVLGKKARPIP